MYNHIRWKHLDLSNSLEPSMEKEGPLIQLNGARERSSKILNSFTNFSTSLCRDPAQALCAIQRDHH